MAGGKKLAALKKTFDGLVKDASKPLDDLERSSNNFYGPTTGSFSLLLEGIDALGEELGAIGELNAATPTAAVNRDIIACLKGIADMKQRALKDSNEYWTAAGQLKALIPELDTLIKSTNELILKKEGKILTQKTLPDMKVLAKTMGTARGEWSLLVQIGPHKKTHRLLA